MGLYLLPAAFVDVNFCHMGEAAAATVPDTAMGLTELTVFTGASQIFEAIDMTGMMDCSSALV